MRIGIPRESRPGETLIAATPASVAALVRLGYEVCVEAGAGVGADFAYDDYTAAGARQADAATVWGSDIVAKINAPTDAEIAMMRRGSVLIAMLAPARSPELVEKLNSAGITALAIDAVPRISRAQAMDVLSSMANVAGYRAVVEAAHTFGRQFTGQVTAAGKVPPARVFVVGAGVAGLAAIGAASAMGAVVRAFDVRREVGEQVRSMGAQFVEVAMPAQESSDGYAREMTAAQQEATAAMYDAEARAADIVITTALIPGREAPRLISAETVAQMKPGSVIVDMAAASGGNVAGTEPGAAVVTPERVTIIGYTDLASRMAAQASQLFGTNVVNLLTLLTPEKDGQLVLDMDDVVQRGITVTRDGEVMWPPPPVAVSAAPAAPAAAAPVAAPAPRRRDPRRGLILAALGALIFLLVSAWAPPVLLSHVTVFMLAVFVGYYVISNVAHALHTPLMSETNAISGIILVGGILQIGSDNLLVTILAFVAVLVASINIFGGFLVTLRMLQMFRKG